MIVLCDSGLNAEITMWLQATVYYIKYTATATARLNSIECPGSFVAPLPFSLNEMPLQNDENPAG